MARGWIRLEAGSPTAVWHTVAHRIPRTRRISLALAMQLAAVGVPVVRSAA
jgi:hypothetical protein